MTATTIDPAVAAAAPPTPPVAAVRGTRRAADRMLVDTVRQGGWWVPALAVAHTGVAVSTLLMPAVLASALDAVLAPGATGTTAALLLFGGLVVADVAATFLLELAQPYAAAASTTWLRRRLVDRVLAAGVAGLRRFGTGDLITRLGSNTATAAAAGSVVLSSAVGLVTSGGAVVALFLLDPLVGGAFVVGVPIGLVVLTRFVRQSSDLYGRYQQLQGEVAGRFVDAMAGIRTIRSAGTADRELQRVVAPLPELATAGRGIWRMQGMVTWRIQVLAPFMEIGVLMLVGWLVTTGRSSPGDLVAAAAYTAMGLTFFDQGSLLIGLSRSRAAALRAVEVLGDPGAEPAPGVAPLPAADRGGELHLHGVTVRAADRALLDAVDVRVPAGAVVALVGRSGSGKSTLAAVAGRLIDPDEGSVLLDGVELRAADPGAVRRAVAFAFDRPVLLGSTVLDALGYGCPDAAPGDLVAAATATHADGFVRRLPCGYDTPIAEAPFSGGEAQRLGLARAVARRSRLLIMDDATSSLDTVTEAQVVDAIATALAGRSRLVVAHRASTAARADEVVWLDGGRVRRVGRHAQLWADPAYRAVFEADGDRS